MSCAVVLRGPSQSGKSTFMKMLMEVGQGDLPAVGDGSGESVTQDTMLRNTKVGLMVDGPGDNDTMLRFSNEEAGQRYAVAVAAAGVTQVKFLLFDSMASDTMQLRKTLSSLAKAFGEMALAGVVVVMSKKDMRPGLACQKRLEAVQKVMAEQKLVQFVMWQSEGLNEAGHAEQLGRLKDALDCVSGVATSSLQDLWQRQRTLAQELCDTQPARTRDIEDEEKYLIPYSEEETWTEQEPYQTTETYEVQEGTYQTTETQTVQVPQDRPLNGIYQCRHDYTWKGDLLGADWSGPMDWNGVIAYFHSMRGDIQHFSINRGNHSNHCRKNFHARLVNTQEVVLTIADIMGHSTPLTERTVTTMVPQQVDANVTRFRMVSRTRPVTRFRPVPRSLTVERERAASRTVTRTIEYRLPLEDFYAQALHQIISQIRGTFTSIRGPSELETDDMVRPEDSVSQVAGASTAPAGLLATPSEVESLASMRSQLSWISVRADAPRCFMPDTLFTADPSYGDVFVSARLLVKGSRVLAADGLRMLEVVTIKRHTSVEVMELRIGETYLKVTPTHRVMVPERKGSDVVESVSVVAGSLAAGDFVLCSTGKTQDPKAHELTEVNVVSEETEVLEITFRPDEPVAVFLPPQQMILTKGEELKNKKPCRRGGMNKRGQGKCDYLTAPGEYED